MKYLILLSALFTVVPAFAEVPGNAEKTNPLETGQPVPAVIVADSDGNPVSLKEKVSGNPSVLIFYRGSWCPYCNKHLASLLDIEEDLRDLGYELIAISPDRPEGLKKAIEENNLNYTLLSDSSAEAARAFGVAFKVSLATRTLYKGYGIDLEEASGKDHHILPVPAVFVVDEKGVIQFVYSNPDYKVRLSPEKILKAAKDNAPAEKE